jgi:hypothetical protein
MKKVSLFVSMMVLVCGAFANFSNFSSSAMRGVLEKDYNNVGELVGLPASIQGPIRARYIRVAGNSEITDLGNIGVIGTITNSFIELANRKQPVLAIFGGHKPKPSAKHPYQFLVVTAETVFVISIPEHGKYKYLIETIESEGSGYNAINIMAQ